MCISNKNSVFLIHCKKKLVGQPWTRVYLKGVRPTQALLGYVPREISEEYGTEREGEGVT
jgi:hypothetical protein